MLDRLGQGHASGLGAKPLDQSDKAQHLAGGRTGLERRGRGIQAAVGRTGGILQLFDRTRTDAAGREIHHSQKGGVIGRVFHQPQIGQGVLDFGPLEKPQPAIHPVRDSGRKKGVLEHAGLRIRAIEDGHVVAQPAFGNQAAGFLDQPLRLLAIADCLEHPHRFAGAGIGPEFLAQATAVATDQLVGAFENVGMRAVVLLELDEVGHAKLMLEGRHVADIGAAKCIDRLVVIAHGKHRRGRPGKLLDPLVLQDVGVLELVDQDVRKAGAVVITQQCVTLQKLIGAQQQFGEINHALALALSVVGRIEFGKTPAVVVGDVDIFRAQPGFLRAIDEVLQIARRVFFIVDIAGLEQALDGGKLVGRIENLKGLG